MKKNSVKKMSRAAQVSSYTYENYKTFSSHEINIRLTEQMTKITQLESTIVDHVAKLRELRQALEVLRAMQTGLTAILDLRR
jgi:hypothetical protein